jgi:hypothetical protein
MNMPGYSAEKSLYQTSRSYNTAGSVDSSVANVQPALIPPPRGSCQQICGGDPDCIQCCVCIRRGGHPWQCCF